MMYNFNKNVKKFIKEGSRRGQSIMNTLAILDKELYDMIKGTALDCHYSNDVAICNDVIEIYKNRQEDETK